MLSLFLLLFSLQSPAAIKVAIDPGHGGSDKGAVHHDIHESEVALKVSKYLYKELKKNRKFSPYLLRNKNKDLSLEARVSRSEKKKIDIFLSIHANANPNPNIRGAEFYIQNQMPIEEENLFLANRENHVHSKAITQKKKPSGPIQSILYDLDKTERILESYRLSHFLRKNWPQSEKRKKRYMIRQGPFYVLSQSQTPAVLIEVGYLSHDKDREKLITPSYQKKLAQQIYRGLLDYVKNSDIN